MAFWVVALIILAISIAALALLPKPKFEQRKAAGLGDFQFPTVEEARVIPVIRGRIKQGGYNTLDRGNFTSEPIKKKIPNMATFGITKKSVVVGYRYHVALILSFAECGWPVHLRELFVDEHSVWTGDITSGSITIDKPDLHGGDEKGGGFSAILDWYGDAWEHAPLSYWESVVMGGDVSPTYNGQAILVQKGPGAGKAGNTTSGYFSTSTTVPPMAAVLQCCPTPFGDNAKAVVNDGDYNLANFFWEYVTNLDWGLSEPVSKVDLASFVAAQNLFFTEGMGVSVSIESVRKVGDFVHDMERLADCMLFVHPVTGLWTLKTFRGGYDVNTLKLLDESNVSEWIEYKIPAPVETVNHVIVKYLDKTTWKEKLADAKNTAGRYNQNYAVTSEISQWGCANADLAARLALREQIQIALNLPNVTIRANREAEGILAGDVFRLARTSKGMPERVFRAIRVRDEGLVESDIEIECVLDVFYYTTNSYAIPAAPPGNLIGNPTAATAQQAEEQPYFFSSEHVRAQAYAGQPNGSQESFDLYLSLDGGTTYNLADPLVDFCPVAAAVSAYPRNTSAVDASSLIVTNVASISQVDPFVANDLRLAFNIFVWETGEVCACESVTDIGSGQFRLNNVWRGLLDTPPTKHAAGEKLFFVPYGYGQPDSDFPDGATIKFKLLPRTFNGVLALGSATALTLTTAKRARRPLPPGNAQIGGSYTSTSIPAAGTDITLSWAHRDRLQQTTVYKQDDSGIGPEAGTTYTIKVFKPDGTLLQTYASLTGTSWTHTILLQTADGSDLETALIYQLTAVRDGLNSWKPQVKPAARPSGTVPTTDPPYTLT